MLYLPYDPGVFGAPSQQMAPCRVAFPTAWQVLSPSSTLPGSAEDAAGVLPTPEELPSWFASLAERDGVPALIRALLQAVGRGSIMSAVEEVCGVHWGEEPLIVGPGGQGEVCWRQLICSCSSARTQGC